MQMITPEETRHIMRIVDRAMADDRRRKAVAQAFKTGPVPPTCDPHQLTALIAGCHLNACRLNLKQWAEADAKAFDQDLQLIRACYDPQTEKLRATRRPLCAARYQRRIADFRPSNDRVADPDAELFAAESQPGLHDLAGRRDEDGEGDE